MPPRFAFWTILIDNKPTAFRAAKRDELLPTLNQLKRTNPVIQMRWFAQGKLWDNPEQAQWAREATRRTPKQAAEKRGRDWRPGGTHEDPRARFDKRKKRDRQRPSEYRPPARRGGAPVAQRRSEGGPAAAPQHHGARPIRPKPRGPVPPKPREGGGGGGGRDRGGRGQGGGGGSR